MTGGSVTPSSPANSARRPVARRSSSGWSAFVNSSAIVSSVPALSSAKEGSREGGHLLDSRARQCEDERPISDDVSLQCGRTNAQQFSEKPRDAVDEGSLVEVRR